MLGPASVYLFVEPLVNGFRALFSDTVSKFHPNEYTT